MFIAPTPFRTTRTPTTPRRGGAAALWVAVVLAVGAAYPFARQAAAQMADQIPAVVLSSQAGIIQLIIDNFRNRRVWPRAKTKIGRGWSSL